MKKAPGGEGEAVSGCRGGSPGGWEEGEKRGKEEKIMPYRIGDYKTRQYRGSIGRRAPAPLPTWRNPNENSGRCRPEGSPAPTGSGTGQRPLWQLPPRPTGLAPSPPAVDPFPSAQVGSGGVK